MLWAALAFALALALVTALPRTTWSVLACFAAGCLIGILAGIMRAPDDPPPLPSELPTTIAGTIDSDPLTIAGGSLAFLQWRGIDGATRRTAFFLPPAPDVFRGDAVNIALETDPDPVVEPLAAEAVVVIERATGLDAARNAMRATIEEHLNQRVPGAPGALALGLLIGDDSDLPANHRDDLRAAGLSHITAVSGWNVTVVVSAIAAAFAIFGLRGPAWTAVQILGLATFVWIVGAEPPVVRAALMCLAVFAARGLGRPAHSITLLAVVAAAMVCVSPGLLSSISFQLTIAATAGLLVAGAVASFFSGWQGPVIAALLTAACAGMATMPIIAAAFGSFSITTIPANVVASPLVPLAAATSAATVLLAPIPGVGIVIGSLAWLTNAAILRVAEFFAGVPQSNWQFEPISTAAQAGVFTALLLVGGALTPEGRLIRRRVGTWAIAAPVSCAFAVAGASAVPVVSIATL
jgi:ComEC/Rec2-related protein